MLYRWGAVAWIAAVVAAAPQAAGAQTSEVIPPGQEAVVERMLTLPDKPGCELGDIKVQRTRIATSVTCGTATWAVELHHVTQAASLKDRVGKTERFAVSAGAGYDAGLVAGLLSSIRKHEAAFRWVAASRAPSAAPTDLPSPTRSKATENDPLRQRYDQGWALYEAKRHAEAFDFFLAMAREHPTYAGVLGMLVANLAPQQPDAARVKAMQQAADAKPGSPLESFLAGVAAHYSAHYRAETVAQKKALYADSIAYLERARPAFDFEPRIFIYLAVSHFRLGNQAQAEQLIEQGVALNRQDPDAFYCRAEIFHRKDPARAIEDIDRYLELTRAEGGVAEGKVQRVKNMRAYLVRVQNGEQELMELWDPITGDNYEVPEGAAAMTRYGPWLLVGLAALVLLLSGAAFWWRRRRSAP